MKKLYALAALLLILTQSDAQCERNTFVLAPAVYKYGNGGLGVGFETGFIPVQSKLFVTLKANFWTKQTHVQSRNTKGGIANLSQVHNKGFAGVKLNYVPQAFEGQSYKWNYSAAAGFVFEEGEERKPALELSAAYLIRLPAGHYNNGAAHLKVEGLCLAQPDRVLPGLGLGIFVLL